MRQAAPARRVIARGRGRRLADTVADLSRYFLGWVAYYRLAEVKASFEDVDKWVRRKRRGIRWRQWKRPRTRLRELCRRGLELTRARTSALTRHGPWWNAGASHVHVAVPSAELRRLGLVSLLAEHQRLTRPA